MERTLIGNGWGLQPTQHSQLITNRNIPMRTHQSNIDHDEVAQFAAQAADWWDTRGPFRMLHRLGPVRLGFVREAAEQHFRLPAGQRRPFAGLTGLDVGCGGGLLTEPLARLGAAATGIDPAEANIETARRHAAGQGIEINYRATTAETLAAEGERFDFVVCLEVIEHVPDPALFIQTLTELVRPGGLLVLSTINRTPKSYALAIIGAEYILRWLPRGTHDWSQFVTTRELERYCSMAGLRDYRCEGVVYDPFSDNWRRASDTDVNYMAAAAKPS